MESGKTVNIVSIDLEDWFHILDLDTIPPIKMWGSTPSRIEANTEKILQLLNDNNIRATFFVLAWIAEKNPLIIKKIQKQGHEIASHGYSHDLIYHQTPDVFGNDIKKSKSIIENITGEECKGFRAPGFSMVEKTPWVFEKVAEAGYRYDSSVFPMKRGHGGLITDKMEPHIINTKFGDIVEFPISVVRMFFANMYFFGGGYFRLFPYYAIKLMATKVNKENRPVIVYLHPRDIDGEQPRIKMSVVRRFKSYVNVGEKTYKKADKLFGDFKFLSFKEYLNEFY